MENEKKIIIKSGFWYTVSNFLVRSMGFITTPIFTRILTQEEYGAYNNYISWANILVLIITLNVSATLISARYEHEDRLDEYILSMLSLSTLSALLWWLGAQLFMDDVVVILNMNEKYVNALFLYMMSIPAINLFQTKEQFFYRYKTSVAISTLLAVGTSLLSVILVLCWENGFAARVLGYIVPYVAIGLLLCCYHVHRGKKITVKYWGEALKIVLPYIPHSLSLVMLSTMDRVMITKLCGERETALYSLAYTIASIIVILLSTFNNAFSPWLGGMLASENYKEIRKVSKIYILVFCYFAVGLMLITPEMLWILGGEAYLEAKWVMLPVTVGCVCQFLYTLFVNIEQFKKKTFGMALASISAAALNLLLNWIFIPRYGYIAAAYTTLVGYLWLLMIHMFLVYRLKFHKAYSYSFVIGIFVLVCIIAVLIGIMYSFSGIRYGIIAGYAVLTLIVFWKSKEKCFEILLKR